MTRKNAWIGAIAALSVAGVGMWCALSESPMGEVASFPPEQNETSAPKGESPSLTSAKNALPSSETSGGDNASPLPEEFQTEEEKTAAAAEAKVEAFDSLTDKWMEPSKAGITMKDVDGFIAAFRQIPKDRQDECIHRALNLVPDENVMLLVGVLMDKTMDKEIVETVFNDVLNRDEDVKKPILQQIFKDKTHPCWADTAWILDVTGEMPSKGGQSSPRSGGD